MIRRTNVLRAGALMLAALPLLFQIAAEARQTAAPPVSASQSPEYFESSVRPVLAANCYDCHADEKMAGLRLDSRDGLLKGGTVRSRDRSWRPRQEPADPGGAADARHTEDAEGRTPEAGRDRRAGRVGARGRTVAFPCAKPAAGKPADPPARCGGQAPGCRARVACVRDQAGAARLLVVSAAAPDAGARRLPYVVAEDRHRSFVLARLEGAGLAPVRAADKRTLLRRATLDLMGLPPTPDEIDAFEKDDSPTRSPRSSTACWRRRTTAKRGAACGSTSPATAKTTTARSIPSSAATTRTRTRISTATG